MKIKSLFFVLLMLAFVVSCSSDDDSFTIIDDDQDQDQNDGDGDNGDTDPDAIDFLPASVGNYWTYLNEATSNREELNGTGDETLTVAQVNGDVISFENQVGETPGFITGALANGIVEKSNNQYIYSGSLDFFDFEGMEFDIPFSEMVLLDADASEGDVLYSIEDSFSQEIPFGDLGNFTIQVSYTLTNTQGVDYDSFMEYNHVKSTKMTLTDLSIIIQGIPVIGSLELMENTTNEAFVSYNYYAEGVGLIKSENQLNLGLIDLEEIIPIPLEGLPELGLIEAELEQSLTDYSLN